MGLGGASLGKASTPVGVVPRAQPVTNSCLDASVGVILRFGSHLEEIYFLNVVYRY